MRKNDLAKAMSSSRFAPQAALNRWSQSISKTRQTLDKRLTPSRISSAVCPLIFEIDNSPSTWEGGGIKEIRAGSAMLASDVAQVPELRSGLEIEVITFDDTRKTKLLREFTPASKFKMPTIPLDSSHSPICETRCRSVIEAIEHRKRTRKEQHRRVRAAWIFQFTDGHATDRENLGAAVDATKLADDQGIQIFPIACGPHPDEELLKTISQPGRPPRRLRQVKSFSDFFEDLFQMLHSRSRSREGEVITLEIKSLEGPGWLING